MAGVCAIKGAVGLDEPFYNYRIGTLVHSSRELDVFTRMETLYLSNDLTGSTELCSLFLHPDYRIGNNGKWLSKSRFLFIAQFPHLFTEKLIAEMRGYQAEDGRSPFYEGLGRHFFKMDFNHVDDLTGDRQEVLHRRTDAAPAAVRRLPAGRCARGDRQGAHLAPRRRAACWSRKACTTKATSISSTPARCCRRACPNCARCATARWRWPTKASRGSGRPSRLLVSNTTLHDFRMIVAQAPVRSSGKIALSASELALLHCQRGDQVRTLSLNVRKNAHV